MKNKGFTLIELLVVIAIIGILSAIVLSSLDTARNKGSDAAIKSDLDNARAQAENFYDSQPNNTYAGVCNAGSSAGIPGILGMMQAAQTASGATSLVVTGGAVGAAATVTCHDSAAGWAAEAPLRSSATTFWCVDSTGTSTSHLSHIASNAVTCTAG